MLLSEIIKCLQNKSAESKDDPDVVGMVVEKDGVSLVIDTHEDDPESEDDD